MTKFEFELNKNFVGSDGFFKAPKEIVKKSFEQVANSAYEAGTGTGFVAGALFTAGVFVLTDVVCSLLSDDKK